MVAAGPVVAETEEVEAEGGAAAVDVEADAGETTTGVTKVNGDPNPHQRVATKTSPKSAQRRRPMVKWVRSANAPSSLKVGRTLGFAGLLSLSSKRLRKLRQMEQAIHRA